MKTSQFRRARRQLWNWIVNLFPHRRQKGIARHLPAAYLQGRGIEIGALADPLRVPASAHVDYVDRFSVEDLLKQYPSLKSVPIVPVSIVSDGESLSAVSDQSQDFVISRHFLEHCQDPIGTLKHFFRVLKQNGIVYFAVPDKRFTFDRDRSVTSLQHLLEDHEHGPERSRLDHFREFVQCMSKPTTEEQLQAGVQELLDKDFSIHYHVWTQHEILELLLALRTQIGFEVEAFCKNRNEMICVLRKDASVLAAAPTAKQAKCAA